MKRLSKPCAGVLAAVYFLTNAALPHAQEANFWRERGRTAAEQRLASAAIFRALPAPERVTQGLVSDAVVKSLPAGFARARAGLFASLSGRFGALRKVSLPASGASADTPVVIHLQDVHRNLEAQKNLGALVQGVSDKARLVALEGAFKPLDLAPYRLFPDRSAFRLVADDMLAKDEVSGPVHAAISGDGPLPLFEGVDDAALHAANVDAYRRSAPLVPALKEKSAALAARNASEKARVFNPALREFDAQVSAYRAGALPLGGYVKTLSAAGASSPQADLFLKALAMEGSLDFAQVERERNRLVEALSSGADRSGMQELLARAAAYRAGELGAGDFHRFLGDFCRRSGVDLARFPAFRAYVDYVLLSDRIDAGRLFEDVSSLESAAFARLARTQAERGLVAESKRIYLTGKLLDLR